VRWEAEAACYGMTHLYFPRNGSAKRALAICAECPVLEQCKAEALELSSRVTLHGVWGGMTQREREAITGRHTGLWINE